MHDADSFSYDEWAWGYCQVQPSSFSSSSSPFTVAFVQVIMKSVREARNRPFSLACQKNKLSRQQWCWMSTLELFYFLLFYWARCLREVFISIYNKLQYCIFLLSVCQPALTFCHRGAEHKATRAGFSVLYCTNKVSIRLWMWICAASTMSWICETLFLFDSDRYCAFELVQIAR